MDKLTPFSFIFASIPEGMVLVFISLVLLGYIPKGRFIRIFIIAMLNSIILAILRFYFPFGVHTLIGLVILGFSIWKILRIELIKSFIIAVFGLIVLGLVESIFIPLLAKLFSLSIDTIRNNDIVRTFIAYPHLIFISLIGILAWKKEWKLVDLYSLVITKANLAVTLVFLLHIFFVTFINLTSFVDGANFLYANLIRYPVAINLFFVSSLVFSILLIRKLFSMAETEALVKAQEAYIKSINDIIDSFRAQRHDFHNHLQTLYVMISKSGNREALNYLNSVLSDFDELNELIRLKNPAIAALLQAKMALASLKNISLEISVSASLEGLKIKSHELVSILGNLIDNAIEAIDWDSQECKENKITVTLSRFQSFFLFQISNPGVIPQDDLDNIFSVGFTTKDGSKHSGLGLSTAKKITVKNKGQIAVQSTEGTGTQFTVLLPA
ncbi:MAG: ATP-binding protein [Clostridia bacterium]|nr:ATP-binding protein [Clostridia bacterium]